MVVGSDKAGVSSELNEMGLTVERLLLPLVLRPLFLQAALRGYTSCRTGPGSGTFRQAA